jgi:adenosylhomocysteine nucleosidase
MVERKLVRILLVAMDIEIDALKSSYNLEEIPITCSDKAQVFSCDLKSNWLIVRSGVGQINTSIVLTELSFHYKIEQIIQFGVGGGISSGVNPGEYVIASSVVQHDAYFLNDVSRDLMGTGELFLSKKEGEKIQTYTEVTESVQNKLISFCQLLKLSFHVGSIASGSSFVSSTTEKKRISEISGSIMVEMEAAAASYFAKMNNIEYGFLKVCSDSLEPDSDIQYKNFIEENIKNIVELLKFCD